MTRDRHNLDTRVLFAGAWVSWASTAPSSSFAMLLGFSFTLQSTAIAAIRSLPKLSKRFVPCHAHTPWYLSCRLSKDPKDHEQNERRLAKRRQTLPKDIKRQQSNKSQKTSSYDRGFGAQAKLCSGCRSTIHETESALSIAAPTAKKRCNMVQHRAT